ncbi:hypothetical protein AB837_00420 [bacterium AB1]|nr:hypothetical protein AB837_00420 [bacterium AB1]
MVGVELQECVDVEKIISVIDVKLDELKTIQQTHGKFTEFQDVKNIVNFFKTTIITPEQLISKQYNSETQELKLAILDTYYISLKSFKEKKMYDIVNQSVSRIHDKRLWLLKDLMYCLCICVHNMENLLLNKPKININDFYIQYGNHFQKLQSDLCFQEGKYYSFIQEEKEYLVRKSNESLGFLSFLHVYNSVRVTNL